MNESTKIQEGYRNPDRGKACVVCGHNWWDKVDGKPFERCRYCWEHGSRESMRFVRVDD